MSFLCGFISIKMARIVVSSLNLTQPLLLYPGLGPAMLEQHRRSYKSSVVKLQNTKLLFIKCKRLIRKKRFWGISSSPFDQCNSKTKEKLKLRVKRTHLQLRRPNV
jgi:hypothetical protein